MGKLIAWLIEGQLHCPQCCHPKRDEIDCGHASPRYELEPVDTYTDSGAVVRCKACDRPPGEWHSCPACGESTMDQGACCGTCHHTIACCAGLGGKAADDCFECSVADAVAEIRDAVWRATEVIRVTQGEGVAAEALRRFKGSED